MRIIVKIGSSSLTHETGKLNLQRIDRLARVLSDLNNRGHEVILVSSGAQVVGMSKLGLSKKPETLQEKQAVAAVGQSELMSIYDRTFSGYGYNVGQILLTKDVFEAKEREQNVINTFNALLGFRCVPIVNENDSVEVEEIKFGDNDTLSAIVAICTKADLLVLLTDIDALYDSDPNKNPQAKAIRTVERIDDSIRTLAGDTISGKGTGGMITKIHAAEIATAKGIDMYIASGSNPDILYDILDQKPTGTLFKGKKENI